PVFSALPLLAPRRRGLNRRRTSAHGTKRCAVGLERQKRSDALSVREAECETMRCRLNSNDPLSGCTYVCRAIALIDKSISKLAIGRRDALVTQSAWHAV